VNQINCRKVNSHKLNVFEAGAAKPGTRETL